MGSSPVVPSLYAAADLGGAGEEGWNCRLLPLAPRINKEGEEEWRSYGQGAWKLNPVGGGGESYSSLT